MFFRQKLESMVINVATVSEAELTIKDVESKERIYIGNVGMQGENIVD